jgi:hypothetical protein
MVASETNGEATRGHPADSGTFIGLDGLVEADAMTGTTGAPRIDYRGTLLRPIGTP